MVALTIPGITSVGLQSTRVYHSSLPAQVRSSFLECGGLAAAFTVARPLDNLAVMRAIKIIFTQALTCFYILSNIRPFPGGSPVMPRTSRCFAGTFLQLGGPDTLLSVVYFPLNLPFADFSFAHFQACSVAKEKSAKGKLSGKYTTLK